MTFTPDLALYPNLSNHKNPATYLSDKPGAPPPYAELVSAVNYFIYYLLYLI